MPSMEVVAVKEELELQEEERSEETAAMVEEPRETTAQPMEASNEGQDTERVEPGIMGGLGLLCDVAHRFIEEEAAASRPQSPCEEIDKKSIGI